jgi:hypothetical protein
MLSGNCCSPMHGYGREKRLPHWRCSTIKAEEIEVISRYAYAHMMCLLVLAGFRDLKGRAFELLRSLPLAGGEPGKQVSSKLAVLK